MEPDISNMTLNEYLMYQGRYKGLERSYTSSKSVAPVRNRILLYPDFDEDDEEYCSLPPLLPCFQTPQPCATLNPVYHNNHSEVDIESMTLEEYARYELAMSTIKNEIQESSFDEILDDLFRIGAENIRKMEHEVLNRCDDINDYEDSDQENGELLDLPTFSATNEITIDGEQVEENIDIAKEKEEVPMKDVEMDENHDIDQSGTKEALQWSLAKDPFLVVMELNDQSSFLLHTISSFVANDVKKEFTTPHMYKFLTSCALPVAYLHPYGSITADATVLIEDDQNTLRSDISYWIGQIQNGSIKEDASKDIRWSSPG
ncbi:hypothetical protein Tco_0832078 [Tanacetum coccineum]